MNGLEQKMADILTEIGAGFNDQWPVGDKNFSVKCRSKYDCRFREVLDYEDWSECSNEDYATDTDCNWLVPEQSHPLYILDFAVFIEEYKICLECDGFMFHHAYEYQIQNDLERDHWLISEGWIVKRYAGITITNHRSRVKKELSELLASLKPIVQKSLF